MLAHGFVHLVVQCVHVLCRNDKKSTGRRLFILYIFAYRHPAFRTLEERSLRLKHQNYGYEIGGLSNYSNTARKIGSGFALNGSPGLRTAPLLGGDLTVLERGVDLELQAEAVEAGDQLLEEVGRIALQLELVVHDTDAVLTAQGDEDTVHTLLERRQRLALFELDDAACDILGAALGDLRRGGQEVAIDILDLGTVTDDEDVFTAGDPQVLIGDDLVDAVLLDVEGVDEVVALDACGVDHEVKSELLPPL